MQPIVAGDAGDDNREPMSGAPRLSRSAPADYPSAGVTASARDKDPAGWRIKAIAAQAILAGRPTTR